MSLIAYPQEKYPRGNADMVIKGNKIWVLTKQGTVHALDINTAKIVAEPPERNNNFVAIDTDKNGSVILSRFDSTIVALDEKTLLFKELYTSPATVYDVVFSHDNKPLAITSVGIADLSTGKTYAADTSFYPNHQIKKWLKPSVVTVDADDNIWIGNDQGEWGGELFVFNMANKQFVKTNIGTIKEKGGRFAIVSLYPTQSIISVGKSVYVSFDFGNDELGGCIMRFDGFKCDSVLFSRNIWPEEIQYVNGMQIVQVHEGDYAGPGLYNDKDGCFYFYSRYYILKGAVAKDLSKPREWTKYTRVRTWPGKEDEMGVEIVKMAFAANGKLYLLSQNYGIGVFDKGIFKVLNPL